MKGSAKGNAYFRLEADNLPLATRKNQLGKQEWRKNKSIC